jgi:F-type H+-transporting ATPase subunit epsilon
MKNVVSAGNKENPLLQHPNPPTRNASTAADARGRSLRVQRQASETLSGAESESWSTMRLKVLLPYQIFVDEFGVNHVMVVTRAGAFGLLPHRLDCTAAILPGILAYRNKTGEDVYLAVDEGVLIKTGPEVTISVRNAIGGQDLGKLRAAVEREFLNLDERERSLRNLIAKVESDFVRRFLEMQRG